LSISHVINYDMPDTTDAYTHRIGRTGRAKQTGEAYTLVTSEDTDAVRSVERVLGYKLERRTVPGFDYTASAPARDREFARDPRPPMRHAGPDRSLQPSAPAQPFHGPHSSQTGVSKLTQPAPRPASKSRWVGPRKGSPRRP
jgi:ATP-dependent RNA helicase RhlE